MPKHESQIAFLYQATPIYIEKLTRMGKKWGQG